LPSAAADFFNMAVPAITSTTSVSGSSAQAVPNDPRVHKFNTDDAVVVDDDASSPSQRPKEEEEATKEEEENSSSEWEKGYVPRASLHPMRRGSVYANLISQGGGGNSGVMASDAKSWHMSYLKVIVYSLVCT
jgi:hypothetical protein